MARESRASTEAFQCVEPFSVWQDGIPQVFGSGQLVLGDDPILRSHRANFRPVADRVGRPAGVVEQATCAPGEVRGPVVPAVSRTTNSEQESEQV